MKTLSWTFWKSIHELPSYLQQDAKLLLQAAADRIAQAKTYKKSPGVHQCLFCLQCFNAPQQLRKHHTRNSVECLKAVFILKTIGSLTKFESVIDLLVETTYSDQDLLLIDSVYALKQLLCEATEKLLLPQHKGIMKGALLDQVSQVVSYTQNGKAIQRFQDMDGVTKEVIQTLLFGVEMTPQNCRLTGTSFIEGKAWLQDPHIEIFRRLLGEDRQSSNIPKKVPLMITSQTFKEFITFPDKTSIIRHLKEHLISQNVFRAGHFLCDCFLFPININNPHWILLYIDTKRLTFCPINPFTPSTPRSDDSELLMPFLETFGSEFGIPALNLEVPSLTNIFPAQKDSYNCGIYILMYIMAFIEEQENIKCRFPYSAMQFRVLMSAWFLTKVRPTFK